MRSSSVPLHARARRADAPFDTQASKIRRARKGEWEAVYFNALSRGHIKATAASIAGVSERCVYKRASEDSDFAEQEWIAYHLGTAALMKVALERVRDPVRPSDSILIHLLSVREVDHKRAIEHSPPDKRSTETQETVWMEYCTVEEKRRVVEILERAMSRANVKA